MLRETARGADPRRRRTRDREPRRRAHRRAARDAGRLTVGDSPDLPILTDDSRTPPSPFRDRHVRSRR
jgi:hypothetical protein